MNRSNINLQRLRAKFTFRAGEQHHFKQLGYAPPVRCPNCRQAKKDRNNQRDNRRE